MGRRNPNPNPLDWPLFVFFFSIFSPIWTSWLELEAYGLVRAAALGAHRCPLVSFTTARRLITEVLPNLISGRPEMSRQSLEQCEQCPQDFSYCSIHTCLWSLKQVSFHKAKVSKGHQNSALFLEQIFNANLIFNLSQLVLPSSVLTASLIWWWMGQV